MSYSTDQLVDLGNSYRSDLLGDAIPFWFPRSVDEEFGGFLIARDRNGSLIDEDKSVWQQGRSSWMLATLFNTVEANPEWLAASLSGIHFLRNHCFDKDGDGRMFFHVTRDGRPIRKRRYYFSECFATLALAAYARGANNRKAEEEARRLFERCLQFFHNPERLPAKFTDTRPTKGIGAPMILMNVAQQLRETIGFPKVDEWIDRFIEEIRTDFLKPDLECVMEQVAVDGSIIDHFDGRTLNPGHAIECAWFILHEARIRKNNDYLKLGCQMLDWMWERGWDRKYGGLFYFVDVFGKPVQEYWHDMKFWWPHCEAEIATLSAYLLTGENRYANLHREIRSYNRATFADSEYGEWFGYVHRDGRVSSGIKGNFWKGPFHLPRMQWYCWQLLEKRLEGILSDSTRQV